MKLYEITDQYRGLMEMSEELPPEALADTLEGITTEFEEKAISVGYVIKNLTSQSGAIDAEIKRLQDMKKARENRVKSLKDYLLSNMIALDKKKIFCDVFSLSRRKGVPSVYIDNQDAIPEEFLKVSVSADKTAIKKAIASGSEVKGAHIEVGSDSLILR